MITNLSNATAKFVKADCRGMFSDNATSNFIIVLHATSTFFTKQKSDNLLSSLMKLYEIATFSTSQSIARVNDR